METERQTDERRNRETKKNDNKARTSKRKRNIFTKTDKNNTQNKYRKETKERDKEEKRDRGTGGRKGALACMTNQAWGRPVHTTNICTFFVFSEHDFEVESAFAAGTMAM